MVMQIKLLVVVVVVEFLTNPSSWVAFGSYDHVYSRWSNEHYSTQLCIAGQPLNQLTTSGHTHSILSFYLFWPLALYQVHY